MRTLKGPGKAHMHGFCVDDSNKNGMNLEGFGGVLFLYICTYAARGWMGYHSVALLVFLFCLFARALAGVYVCVVVEFFEISTHKSLLEGDGRKA